MFSENRAKKRATPDWQAQQRLVLAARQAQADVLAGFVRWLWRGARRTALPWLRPLGERRQIEALAALDDRLLADIGLERSDVRALSLGRIHLDDLAARRQPAPPSAEVVDLPARQGAPEAPVPAHRHAA